MNTFFKVYAASCRQASQQGPGAPVYDTCTLYLYRWNVQRVRQSAIMLKEKSVWKHVPRLKTDYYVVIPACLRGQVFIVINRHARLLGSQGGHRTSLCIRSTDAAVLVVIYKSPPVWAICVMRK